MSFDKPIFETKRYEKQLPIIGDMGQAKLSNASATVVGLGGLGSPAAQYLAAAGVGELVIVDGDSVALSNLNRQTLYDPGDVGKKKVKVAKARLSSFNPSIEITAIDDMVTEEGPTLPETDVLIGALDNFDTRHLLNEISIDRGIPYVHGAVEGSSGVLTVVVPGQTPCLNCIFPRDVDRRVEGYTTGTTTGVTGSLMANEGVKSLLDTGDLAAGYLLTCDLSHLEFEKVPLERNPDCEVCGSL
ncbi:MAG: HesA/MoeB/ThiF family protein [Candidatus Bipolaricaulota bacterium]